MSLLSRVAATERAEAIAAAASVVMAASMIAVATLSGSVSVLAEGIDTLVDIVTSVAVLVGLRLARRRSSNFPEGLYKIENIVGLAIGILVLVSAYELAGEAFAGLTGDREPVTAPGVAIATMSAVAVVTGLLAWNKGRVGRAENSPSLLADARHSWTDALASGGVVVGVALDAAGVPVADSLMALVIVAILFWSGGQVLLDAIKVLLDASVEREVLDQAAAAAASDPQVREVVAVDGRNSGSYRFLHLAVVPETDDLRDAEHTAQDIRRTVKAAVPNVEAVQVEFAPDPGRLFRVGVPLESDDRAIAPDLATASSCAVLSIDPERGTTHHLSAVVRPAPPDDGPIGFIVALARRGVRAVVVTGNPPAEGAAYVMEANAMDIMQLSDVSTLAQAEASVGTLVADRYGAQIREPSRPPMP